MIEVQHEVEVQDVEYQPGRLARVYVPHGPGPFPAVLSIHGGAWNNGSRTGNEPIDHFLAAGGAVVAAIDFRLAGEAPYPASIADTNLGIRWLKLHAGEFNGHKGGIGAIGTSSGGHQIMLAALRPNDPRYAALPLPGGEGVDATLEYVMLCWPIVDPLARYRMAKDKGRQELVANHDRYWGSEETMAEGNPALLLERGEQTPKPPALVVQGTADGNVTPDMASRFCAAYRKAGGTIELDEYPGAAHTFIGNDPTSADSQRALAALRDFVSRQTGRLGYRLWRWW